MLWQYILDNMYILIFYCFKLKIILTYPVTLSNLISLPYPDPAMGHLPQYLNKYVHFLPSKPDDVFKNLPKFGKINFGTVKVH